jgi:5-formyltetrahydrofolate cyclo-ligase
VSGRRLARAKREMRARVRAARDAIADDERAEASRAISTRVLALPEVERASTVMAFHSFGSEVATVPIVDGLVGRGVRVALPRIEGAEIVAVPYRPGDAMSSAAFGMQEPARGEPLDPAEIDVVVAPGLAFDRACRRVGYGGGFYDRFFARMRPDAAKVAVGFSAQVVDEVPHGVADVPVDAVVTEREVIRCR